MAGSEQLDGEGGAFTTTRWDLIRLAGNQDGSEHSRRRAARALNDLCRIYRAPILAYLERRTGNLHDAEDLAQQFCAERISPALLAQATEEKGRFRSLLLTVLKNFVRDCSDRRLSQRRGGKIQFVPLEDAAFASAPEPAAADTCFDVAWATTVVQRALDHLQHHYTARSDSTSYDQLLPFLGCATERAQLSTLAQRLELTHNAMEVRVSRFRALYARFVRQSGANRGQSTRGEGRGRFRVLTIWRRLANWMGCHVRCGSSIPVRFIT